MGEFVAKKYDNTSHMVWWNGHGMICRTDSLGNAARIADALNAQAAPPALQAELDHARRRIGELTIQLGEAMKVPPAALAVPAENVTPMRQPRADLARLVESINAAVYANGNGLSVTEAIGALELAKLELLKEQEQ